MSPPDQHKLLLMRSKLERPGLPGGLLPRPAVVEQLGRRLEQPITLVSAPAGYGKSTLVAACLESQDRPAAWLSLDRLDSDLSRFLRYFIAALREVVPDILPITEGLLFLQDLPPVQHLAESAVAELELLEQPVILVLDDYHLVKGREVHQWVEWLVGRAPRNFHLVVVTRSDPPLALSLWRSRRWLGELRLAHLRFAFEETAALVNSAVDHRLPEEQLASLHRKTEGWVAGLQLFLMSLDSPGDAAERVEAFSASDRMIADYLLEEVLAGQPAEIIRYIEITSILERFSCQLADELLAEFDPPLAGQSQAIIDRLHRTNLFLLPVGSRTGWYRYHHLFGDLLRERTRRGEESRSNEDILVSAGNWFRREGHDEDAMKCFLAAGDLDSASDMIGDRLHDLMDVDPSRRTLRRWLEMFPAGAEESRIPLQVGWGYIRKGNTDKDGVFRCLESIEAICAGQDNDKQRTWCAHFEHDLSFLRCFAAFWSGDIGSACESARRLPDPAASSQALVGAFWRIYKVASVGLGGSQAEYERLLEHVFSSPGPSDIAGRWPVYFGAANVCLYRGELAQCQELACRLIVDDDFPGRGYARAVGNLLLGNVAYERNRLDEAEMHFQAVASLRYEAPGLAYWNAATDLARIELARGRIESARQHAADAHEFAAVAESSQMMHRSLAVEQHIAAASGESLGFVARPAAYSDLTTLAVVPDSHEWALGEIRSSSASRQSGALEFIDAALERAKAYRIDRRIIQLRALRALALDALERRDEAIPELEAALRLGAEQGFVRSFVDMGHPIRPLLQAVAERQGGDAYVVMLMKALDAEGRPGRQRGGPTAVGPSASGVRQATGTGATDRLDELSSDELTNREMDVLELLSKRLSNKEIAARLSISPATVKMHTLNIYSKFGVHGRRKAVAAAIRLGILSG